MFTPKNEFEDENEQKLHDDKAKSELRKTMRSAEKKLIKHLKQDMTFEDAEVEGEHKGSLKQVLNKTNSNVSNHQDSMVCDDTPLLCSIKKVSGNEELQRNYTKSSGKSESDWKIEQDLIKNKKLNSDGKDNMKNDEEPNRQESVDPNKWQDGLRSGDSFKNNNKGDKVVKFSNKKESIIGASDKGNDHVKINDKDFKDDKVKRSNKDNTSNN